MAKSTTTEKWIFDMDGTLTVPVHDFDAIRADLGLPVGQPILESLAAMPPERAAPLHDRLLEIERTLAESARAWPGTGEVLEGLRLRGSAMAVLTRNSTELAHITLRASGLDHFFDPSEVLGREAAIPKPSPHGIELILDAWGASPLGTTMVGDYLFDLQAGRSAGCRTVLIDREQHGRWREWADQVVGDLGELL